MYDVSKSLKAKTVKEAISLLNENPGALLVAGGSDVMIKVRDGKLPKVSLISILEIEEIKEISVDGEGTIRIGSGCCFDKIYKNEIIKEHIPALANACNQVGSPQIRHIATIGGNICNGAVSADSVPMLYALNAKLLVEDVNGDRIIPIEGFHTGPGKTLLQGSASILKAILIEKGEYKDCHSYYYKSGQRKAMEISSLGCAVNLKLTQDKKHLDWIRFAFGVAAPVPIRCHKLEEMLKGHEIGEDLYESIELEVLKELSPRDSWRASLLLRERLIKTLSVRATKNCIKEALDHA